VIENQVEIELQEVIDQLETEHQDHQVTEVEKEINSLFLLNFFYLNSYPKLFLYIL
jgi:hypothetical protein